MGLKVETNRLGGMVWREFRLINYKRTCAKYTITCLVYIVHTHMFDFVCPCVTLVYKKDAANTVFPNIV